MSEHLERAKLATHNIFVYYEIREQFIIEAIQALIDHAEEQEELQQPGIEST